MMRKLTKISLILALLALLSTTVVAAPEKTVRLSVENMSCSSCPITVRFSLKQIAGVTSAEADMKSKSAIVTFDPDIVTIKMLTDATTNAGYPSTLKEAITH